MTKLGTAAFAGSAIAALGAGCAGSAATSVTPAAGPSASPAAEAPSVPAPKPAPAPAQAPARRQVAHRAHAPRTRIDRLAIEARKRYNEEVWGSAAHQQLRSIAHDPGLLAALRSGNLTQLRTYVDQKFNGVWYHRHVSRMRLVRGSRVLLDVGVPFVVAPSQATLRDAHGRPLATLQTSIQDVIGFVRYMHRNFPVDVVVRGSGAAHVRTSLPAAANMKLPASGTVTVGGRRLAVRSFTEKAWNGEHLKVWILANPAGKLG
jgi:hypothetical protein